MSSSRDVKRKKEKKKKQRRDWTDGPLEEKNKPDCFSRTVRPQNNEGLQQHTAGHSRVVDNLEAIPFFERQVVGRPRLVVVERHKERDATCRRAESVFKRESV